MTLTDQIPTISSTHSDTLNLEKCKYIAGFGVDPYDLEHCLDQMKIVKKYYRKNEDNPLVHFIISFGGNVKKEWQAIYIFFFICKNILFIRSIKGNNHTVAPALAALLY